MRPTPLALALALAASPVLAEDGRQPVSSGSAFNPQISLILGGSLYHDNQRGAGAELVEEADGILHGVHFHEHGHGAENGFNLDEIELVLSATIDPYFDGRFTAAFDGHETHVEEAWVQTRMLPAGLKVKAGRFLSEIGYQNSQHRHAWEFSQQNLAYATLLGDHGLIDNGLQLTWLAPAPFFLQLGAELLQGSEQERFGALVDAHDAEAVLDESVGGPAATRGGPRLGTLFVKAGPDLGAAQALQFGLSYARARQFQQLLDEDDSALSGDEFALEGRQSLYGVDVVYKRDGGGEKGAGSLKLVAEYLRLEKDMKVGAADAGAPVVAGDRVTGTQDGWYVQGVYGVAPRWQLGLRHEVTGDTNEVKEAGTRLGFDASARSTLALTWLPTEFSRLRLELAQGDLYDEAGDKTRLKQVVLGYTMSMGSHGAHRF